MTFYPIKSMLLRFPFDEELAFAAVIILITCTATHVTDTSLFVTWRVIQTMTTTVFGTVETIGPIFTF